MSFQEFAGQNRGMALSITLRRNQIELSKRSAAMAIWLGKQYLGQTDKPVDAVDTEDSDAYFEAAGLTNVEK